MAVPTSERLARFSQAILPTAREVESARARASRIVGRLEKDLDVRKVLEVGSHWKQTAVRRHSDYDLFVVFSREEARRWAPSLTSNTLLGRVRRSIASSYPTTGLRLDGQAVTVRFEQGAHSVDVVPAIFDRFDSTLSTPVYLIPNGLGDWLHTAPELDRSRLDRAHERSGRKLRAVARMLKWWAASRHATYPISSLYLEWFIIASNLPVDFTYQESLLTIFATMAEHGLPPLQDGFGVSQGSVYPVQTTSLLKLVRRVASQSAERAGKAIADESRGRFSQANDRWGLIFNNSFPSVR